MTRLRDATGDNSVRLSLTGRSLGLNSENLTQKVEKVEKLQWNVIPHIFEGEERYFYAAYFGPSLQLMLCLSVCLVYNTSYVAQF